MTQRRASYSGILCEHRHAEIEIICEMVYGCLFSFRRHHFLHDSSCFCNVLHHSAFLQGCRASDELHQLPGCMAVVQLECIHCVFPYCFHQLQQVLPMFCPCFAHVLLCEVSVLDWPLDIQDLCLS